MSGRPWTAGEVARVREWRSEGVSLGEIAARLGRSLPSVGCKSCLADLTLWRVRPAEIRAALRRRGRPKPVSVLARELGCSVSTVGRHRRLLGGDRPRDTDTPAAAIRAAAAETRAGAVSRGWPPCTPGVESVLAAVRARGAATPAEVGSALGRRPHAASVACDRAFRAGLLDRERESNPRGNGTFTYRYRLAPAVAERRRQWEAVNGMIPD